MPACNDSHHFSLLASLAWICIKNKKCTSNNDCHVLFCCRLFFWVSVVQQVMARWTINWQSLVSFLCQITACLQTMWQCVLCHLHQMVESFWVEEMGTSMKLYAAVLMAGDRENVSRFYTLFYDDTSKTLFCKDTFSVKIPWYCFSPYLGVSDEFSITIDQSGPIGEILMTKSGRPLRDVRLSICVSKYH